MVLRGAIGERAYGRLEASEIGLLVCCNFVVLTRLCVTYSVRVSAINRYASFCLKLNWMFAEWTVTHLNEEWRRDRSRRDQSRL